MTKREYESYYPHSPDDATASSRVEDSTVENVSIFGGLTRSWSIGIAEHDTGTERTCFKAT